jgi:hypothetical protein
MALELKKIQEQLKAPAKKKTIDKAIAHQNRIKFHAQTQITPIINQPLTEFLGYVQSLIPNDKFQTFKSLFRYPVRSNEVAGVCFDRLSRVFDGRNPAFNYQFKSSEYREDWEYYRQDVLKEPAVWSVKGWEYFKTEINSVLIIDMPKLENIDPLDRYPQPYFYWLTMDKVISYKADKDSGVMDWIMFFTDEGKNIAVFDSEHYEVYAYNKNDRSVGQLLVSTAHNIGYCPARFFWNEPLNLEEPDVKKHPMTESLAGFDWFLFYAISKQHLDLYGSYPIYSGYEQDCDFKLEKDGTMIEYCDGGFLRDGSGNYMLNTAGLLSKCPKCSDKRLSGAGSFIEVPIPDEQRGIPNLSDPVKMLGADVATLNYNVTEVDRLSDGLIKAVTGSNSELTKKTAVNTDQVKASFEDQQTILNRIKKGFEDAQAFVDMTICLLRYGTDFVSAKINLGTEFYVSNPQDLRDRYKLAKEIGASESELDALNMQIIQTEYRHDPTQLQRMLILAELEPFNHLTRDEVLQYFDKGLITREELALKLNFSNFVRRFERENINILEFGTATDYNNKINIINKKLQDYANETIKRTD